MHPYASETVIFATLHEKEKLLSSLFEELGLRLEASPVNTDAFGTFSGETPRTAPVKETLKKKVEAAIKLNPEKRLFLASEGSFSPHPEFPFLVADHEVLLFYDRQRNTELIAEAISLDVVFEADNFRPGESLSDFLKKARFPEFGLIARAAEPAGPIVKGIRDESELSKVLTACFKAASTVRLENDLRAHMNPARQKVIQDAGRKLIEKLKVLCPACQAPGFSITRGIPGLPCSGCGEPSSYALKVIFQCPFCRFEEEKLRPDGRKEIDPAECDLCNP